MVDILSSVGDKFADEAISVVKKTFDKLVESNKIRDSRGASIFENIKNGIFDGEAREFIPMEEQGEPVAFDIGGYAYLKE